MRVHQDVRRNDLRLQLRVLPGVARILQAAVGAVEIEPGPTVESTFLHVGHVVGHQVIAQPVALVGGAPQFAGRWVDRFADTVP